MALTDDLSDGFFQKLQVMCNNLGCDPQHMLKVWFSESIGIYADAKNPAGAYGLNQITNLAGVGWTKTPAEYLRLTAEEQLPFIEKYYIPYKGRLTSIARIYQVNFLPATFNSVTKPDDVLAGKDGPYAWAYNANPALDPSTPKKGYITLGDLEKVVEGAVSNGYKLSKGGGSYQDRWKEIVDRLQKVSSSAATSFPVPPWLPGWWTVTWRGQIYYYFFDRNYQVKWTQSRPRDTSQPLLVARDTGSFTVQGTSAVTIRWGATGSVEKLGRLPTTTDNMQMGGKWNDKDRLDAVKM
jgi:hypothetical protein